MMLRRRSPGVGLLVGLALGWLMAGQAFSEEEVYAWEVDDEVLFAGMERARTALALNALSEADIREAYEVMRQALMGYSLDDLTELFPHVHKALNVLADMPGYEGYADWLRQRLDYFDMAAAAARAFPRTAEASASPTKPITGGEPVPRTQGRVSVRRAETERARDRAVSSVESWKKSLNERRRPRGAAVWASRLKPIFVEEGLPGELVWLAEVESSFNPQARSPVGAAGLFQFMPATARQYGLSLAPEDERLAPEKSARAAARYLKALHRRFGSWPLALAAYNAGEGRVGRLLKETGKNDFLAIRDRLPMETRMYVPKVEAVIALREGRSL